MATWVDAASSIMIVVSRLSLIKGGNKGVDSDLLAEVSAEAFETAAAAASQPSRGACFRDSEA
jgi:hypothetical protein